MYKSLTAAGIDKASITNTLRIQSVTVDALGYLPIDAAGKFELIGSIGLARTKSKETVDYNIKGALPTESGSETKTDLRLGLGAQYEAFKNFRVRGMVRWENTRFETTDKAILVSLGFNYSF